MLKEIFTKPKKKKYATIPSEAAKQDVPEGIMTKCPNCKKIMYTKELMKNLKVCMHCQYHHSMDSGERVDSFLDERSFEELNAGMISLIILKKLKKTGKRLVLTKRLSLELARLMAIRLLFPLWIQRFVWAAWGRLLEKK